MSCSISSIYCSLGDLTYVISSTTTNLNLQTLIGTTNYTSKVNKKIYINSGVIVGSTSTSNSAITIPSGFGGNIRLINYGSIQGAGGASNGGTGGNAIFAGSSGVIIDNRGTIYAGGGGGGQGGTGGGGYYGTYYLSVCGPCSEVCCGYECSDDPPCSGGYQPGNGCAEGGLRWFCPYNVYTSGGAGGSGGIGQGYNQSATGGSSGSAGGSNAGTGGTGGTGGSFGSTGSTGGTGSNGNYSNGSAGSSGGLAGYYIVNNGNVTWTTLGAVAGRVG